MTGETQRRLIIENGTVLTMDDARTVYFGGHVVLDGDRIAAVGPGPYPGSAQAGDEVIDCTLRGNRVRRFKDFDPIPPPRPTVRLS